MNKTILAFDTAMSNCSVSLFYKKKFYNTYKYCEDKHSKHILPMIKKILDSNNVTLNQIDVIAFSKGPGKFSGTRIAIAIAQGFALGINKPLIELSTTLIMAEQAWLIYQCKKILVILTINKEYIYWIQYCRNKQNYWTKIIEEKALHISQAIILIKLFKEKWTIVGNGWNKLPLYLLKRLNITNILFPQSEYIIHLINSNSYYKRKIKNLTVNPIYLSTITLNKI